MHACMVHLYHEDSHKNARSTQSLAFASISYLAKSQWNLSEWLGDYNCYTTKSQHELQHMLRHFMIPNQRSSCSLCYTHAHGCLSHALCCRLKRETRNSKREAGSWKLETRNWKREAGSWKLVENWKLDQIWVWNWKLDQLLAWNWSVNYKPENCTTGPRYFSYLVVLVITIDTI